MLSPQLTIAANFWKVERQDPDTSGELNSFMKCLISPSKLLIIACLSDLGVPPTEDFFHGDDRHGKLLGGCGGDTCPNGFLPTKP